MAASVIRFDVGALRATVLHMDTVRGTAEKAARSANKQAGTVFLAAVRSNMSRTDHSRSDLAQLDHPYARRHGSILVHTSGGKLIRSKTAVVHRQSGTLLRTLTGQVTLGGLGYLVSVDSAIAPHAVYVIMGTRVMLGRDVIWETAQAEGVKVKMMRKIVDVYSKNLTKAFLRFSPSAGT